MIGNCEISLQIIILLGKTPLRVILSSYRHSGGIAAGRYSENGTWIARTRFELVCIAAMAYGATGIDLASLPRFIEGADPVKRYRNKAEPHATGKI